MVNEKRGEEDFLPLGVVVSARKPVGFNLLPFNNDNKPVNIA